MTQIKQIVSPPSALVLKNLQSLRVAQTVTQSATLLFTTRIVMASGSSAFLMRLWCSLHPRLCSLLPYRAEFLPPLRGSVCSF